ncbi:hypothetical protein NQ317_003128 [Molorchus minor]|uniref:Uncharacterized protein n=1 Tax=Molorchus minor TaxID=1323400 RepID=A0ABQ9JP59_9CUCU|nr:hypothetical protein NQ317_003128 [Molorchus minor]
MWYNLFKSLINTSKRMSAFLLGVVSVTLGDVSHLLNNPGHYRFQTSIPAGQQVFRSGPQYAILRLNNDIFPDGSYRYGYETANGISAQESGQQRGVGDSAGTVAQGSFQYTSPEGVPVQIQYVADENGFQPVGNVLPTSPDT